MILLPDPLPRDILDVQLSPSLSAKDALGVLSRHVRETAALDTLPGLCIARDVAYGPGAQQRMDIATPQGADAVPSQVFVHGGFWQEGGKVGSGFAAAAFTSAGWAHVGIGYTLAPEARLAEIVAELAEPDSTVFRTILEMAT